MGAYIGSLVSLVVIFPAFLLWTHFSGFDPDTAGYPLQDYFFVGVGTAVLMLTIATILLKKLFYASRLTKEVQDYKALMASNPQFGPALEILKEMDPDMARNIRRYL